MEDFAEWLNDELNKRGWRNVDLARVADVSEAQISRVVSGGRKPGPDFCTSIAKGLSIDPVSVFRKAKLLPPPSDSETDPSFSAMLSIMRDLSPENREDVIAYAIWRRNQQKEG